MQNKLIKIFDFGLQPLGNGFISAAEFGSEYYFPMCLGFDQKTKLLQLIKHPEPKMMFHDNYAFFSSTSQYMKKHFFEFSKFIFESPYLPAKEPFVVEIGCNDGILLQNFANKGLRHLGIEPSRNVAAAANKKGVRTISEFFNVNLAEKIVCLEGPVDVCVAANVLCHIPDIQGVAHGVNKLLQPGGILVFEDPYLGDIVEKTSYDQIYDEHIYLFSAHSVKYLFSQAGMELIDLLPQQTHGGSMRYVVAKEGFYKPAPSVKKILAREKALGLDKAESFVGFCNNVEKSKNALLAILTYLKKQGKTVAGYAATSKSTTILNYCKIGPDLIHCIYDTTPLKHGKFSPGMHIPIRPYEEFVREPPDYAFLFAWNHAEEIMAKEQGYMANGGKWITHVPEVRVIG